MTYVLDELSQALKSGYIDSSHSSKHALKPELLLNDGQGLKVLTTLKNQLTNCESFWFSVAFLTTSGIACIKQELLELEKKDIQGKILVSQYLNFTQPEALKELLKFGNIELRIAVDSNFHAKGYLFNNSEIHQLIIGSSNLTSSALTFNKEWNLKVSSTEKGAIYKQVLSEFEHEFSKAIPVTDEFISNYESLYLQAKQFEKQVKSEGKIAITSVIKPNKMQEQALANLSKLRSSGAKKALLISATGTGKTYLSAFDAQQVKPKRLLFVVHRANIARKAMETFRSLFPEKTFGLYSGSNIDTESDFIFTTVQTLTKDKHLRKFDRDRFDYIIIDETHRAYANSYQKVLNYFDTPFLLGMTATPERTDGNDIFKVFDNNIAYEIRLKQALEMEILAPFHYYGVTDLTINGKSVDEYSDLNLLIKEERIKHILNHIARYGSDNGKVRGLVFCSNIDECKALAKAFNDNGLRSIALTGSDTEKQRDEAILRLESNDATDKLDYIFSVGIFNEGIDIPSVNQVVMLRPTESSIIFIQQLGRGLRKDNNKDYLTVIDFIGNYKNNFMVPIALYGDRSFNKDTLRRLISADECCIPGTSTVSFDKIAKERIYESIDKSNLQLKRDLIKDYQLLKFKLGKIPMMMDFVNYGERDPFSYVENAKSYYHFAKEQEKSTLPSLNEIELSLLSAFSKEINNAKRVEESLILKMLIQQETCTISDISKTMKNSFGFEFNSNTLNSIVHNLNLNFVTTRDGKKEITIGTKLGLSVVDYEKGKFKWSNSFKPLLKNKTFKNFLNDSTKYSINKFSEKFKLESFRNGFQLYNKYSRKDVFRILCWSKNPNPGTVGGYIISKDKSNCPIFVNYNKAENIAETIQYEDRFINKSTFSWMSKSNRTLKSPEILLLSSENIPRLPLFIKKHNGEGCDFYYMGDMTPKLDSFKQTKISEKSVVKIEFNMVDEVRLDMYNYITDQI